MNLHIILNENIKEICSFMLYRGPRRTLNYGESWPIFEKNDIFFICQLQKLIVSLQINVEQIRKLLKKA